MIITVIQLTEGGVPQEPRCFSTVSEADRYWSDLYFSELRAGVDNPSEYDMCLAHSYIPDGEGYLEMRRWECVV